MSPTKQKLVDLFYNGIDPFKDFPFDLKYMDLHEIFEWNSDHPYLPESIDATNAKIVVDVGVFMGGSTIKMAEKLKSRGDGCVIAVDDFLADHMLFMHEQVEPRLRRKFGRPYFWKTFYANIIGLGLQDYVMPIHMNSFSALRLINGKHRNKMRTICDMIHVDASHISPMPYLDVTEAWDAVKTGGHIVIDDWVPNQKTIEHDGADFTGIYKDVTKFAAEKNICIEYDATLPKPNKCRLTKI